MTDFPLLLLPPPRTDSCSKKSYRPTDVRKPPANRQWDRLSPKFRQLQTAFDEQRVTLQQTVTGIVPDSNLHSKFG
jgi:hypothetical protein